jgi:hypothetical protein
MEGKNRIVLPRFWNQKIILPTVNKDCYMKPMYHIRLESYQKCLSLEVSWYDESNSQIIMERIFLRRSTKMGKECALESM